VTAAAVHELAAEGRLDLDAPVDDVLPFPVDHPTSDVRITAAMLLEHTSALRDNNRVIWGHYAPGDPTEPLEHWLRDVLVPGGAHFSETKNFADRDPGTRREYSNTGYALLGFVVEAIAGEPFDQWCDEHLFAPLGMDDTAWMLADLPEERVARPYARGVFGLHARPHYGFPDYPDGQLRTTVGDFARFMGMLRRGGTDEDGFAVLDPRAAERLWGNGMGVDRRSFGDHTLRGHGGSDRGVRTGAWLDNVTGRGFLVFLNRRVHTDRQHEAFACLEEGLTQAAFEE
jgi:CubicO group peptidase (beta-lactamase class C family)